MVGYSPEVTQDVLPKDFKRVVDNKAEQILNSARYMRSASNQSTTHSCVRSHSKRAIA
jgi:hypothetical protein